MAYQATFKPSFLKDLAKLPTEVRERCAELIEQIISDPYDVSAKKLGGYEHLYRSRLGDYRVVYYINSQARRLLFLLIAHRKDVYRYLGRMRIS
ncbi:MAG: type II toxin-antitoxin system RelE/ParE family toxin [Deltaproteobacteria bacterium]|nr:type II toxin-antitoxin system RelE/ParE family toxin [Deltaproteobacteria bacterium]